MNQEPDLGEQALDKATEFAISSQLDAVDQIDVDIRTDPLQLVQGKVDSVTITGEGLVIKQDLRAANATIQTDAVSINPIKAVMGEIELNQPANAQAQVLLTETDLNRALNSDYLRNKFRQLDIEVEGQTIAIVIEHIQLQLLQNQQIGVNATISTETNDTVELSTIVKPVLKENGQRVELEILSADGQGLSLRFLAGLFQKLIELLDFRNFELGGASFSLRDLQTHEGRLSLQGIATINQMPALTDPI
jgi:hypothetical protein